MKAFRKIIVILLALLILTGCSSVKPIEPEEGDIAVVMQADGYDICYDELRYFTCNLKRQMADYYGADIWADDASAAPYIEELESSIAGMCNYNAAVLALCAEFGISIEEDGIQDDVQEQVEALVDELGSMRAYREALAEQFMTDRLFRYLTGVSLCETELYGVLIGVGIIDDTDEGAQAFFDSADFIRTLHIFISNDEGESVDANRAEALQVYNELQAGADFNTMIGRHSEDFYMTSTSGYYFTRGEMLLDYEEAAFALPENAYSEVVEVEDGFYIIKRLPKDPDHINRNFEDLKHQYLNAMFYNIIEERREAVVLTATDYGKTLSLREMQ